MNIRLIKMEDNYSYIQFGDNIRLSWGKDYYWFLDTDGKSSRTTQIGQGRNSTFTKKIEVIFNTASKNVEKITFDGTDLTNKMPASLTGSLNKIIFGFIRGGRVNWTVPNYINSIKVRRSIFKI